MERKFAIGCIIIAIILSALFFMWIIFSPPQPPYENYPSPPRVDATPIAPSTATSLATDTTLYVSFSHDEGFFDADFYLILTAPEGADIFFTLDGSVPTMYSARFDAPLFLHAPTPDYAVAGFAFYEEIMASRVRVVSVKAIAIYGESASDVITRNFVMGTDVFERFCEHTLIFAVTSDPHGLFDHYDGIFVAGVDRENWRNDFIRRHGRIPVVGYGYMNETPASPANFNRRGRESERAAHVTMFDHVGTQHINQRIGIRVRGGFSRASEPQKSFELFARAEYGDRNNFAFAFFPDEFDHEGNLIDRYRRVRLRNGGSDRYPAFLRDELSQTLFRQAGHNTTQTHRPAAIFLNGEYYGAAWLKSPRTPNHLARLYGGNSAQFEIISGGENLHTSWWDGEPHAVADFIEVHQLAIDGFTGIGGEERLAEFSMRVDLDALILDYAMQIFINNLDWPNNNIEFWRYFPTYEEKNDPNLHPFLRDGRWRVFAHDVEAGWAIWDNYDQHMYFDTICHILNGSHQGWNWSGSSAILHAFVNHEETRQKLAQSLLSLIDGAFNPHNVERVLDELIAQITNEHTYMMKMDRIGVGSGWWPTPDTVANSRDAIRRFAHGRPQIILDMIDRHLS